MLSVRVRRGSEKVWIEWDGFQSWSVEYTGDVGWCK